MRISHNVLILGLLATLWTMTPCAAAIKNVVEQSSTSMGDSGIGKKTRKTLDIFEQISAIPRCSGHEKRISKWLEKWAKNHGFKVQTDRIGNVMITVPATKGYENAASIELQGHMDMVCEKRTESNHDFSKDPIRFVYDGEWLTADNTTLGADNGIGIALCLALATDHTVAHPRLEFLFTVEEETGLTGAQSLRAGFMKSTVFINLDSEEEGTLTIGAAGGEVTLIILPVSTEQLPEGFNIYKLRIDGLRGGHSGVDIHKHNRY